MQTKSWQVYVLRLGSLSPMTISQRNFSLSPLLEKDFTSLLSMQTVLRLSKGSNVRAHWQLSGYLCSDSVTAALPSFPMHVDPWQLSGSRHKSMHTGSGVRNTSLVNAYSVCWALTGGQSTREANRIRQMADLNSRLSCMYTNHSSNKQGTGGTAARARCTLCTRRTAFKSLTRSVVA